MKHVIVVEAGRTGGGFNIIDCAFKLGFTVSFLCKSVARYEGLDIHTYINNGLNIIEVDTSKDEALFTKLKERFADKAPDGILCLSEYGIETATKVAEFFQLPFISEAAVNICKNKELAWEFCAQQGIRTPKTYLIHSLQQAIHLATEKGYPVVLKSSRGAGGSEVILCLNEIDLHTYYPLIQEKTKTMQGQLMLQEYVRGPTISVEALTFQGKTQVITITDYIKGSVPYFVVEAATLPVDLGEKITHQLTHIISEIMLKLNISYAITHTEFILTKDGPVLIEINPRLAGIMIGKMICEAYDFDLYAEIIQLSLNKKPNIPQAPKKAMTQYFLYPRQAGIIKEICGLDLAATSPGIHTFTQYMNKGDEAMPATDFLSKPIAMLLATGDTAAHAKANCFAALSNIVVHYETI